MNCPSCNQSATSFLRNAFSLQGVSISQSMKGYLRCQQCGAMLRITSYGKVYWSFIVGTLIVVGIFAFAYRHLIAAAGPGATAAIWVVLLLIIVFTFTFGVLKFAQVEKVETGSMAKQSQSG